MVNTSSPLFFLPAAFSLFCLCPFSVDFNEKIFIHLSLLLLALFALLLCRRHKPHAFHLCRRSHCLKLFIALVKSLSSQPANQPTFCKTTARHLRWTEEDLLWKALSETLPPCRRAAVPQHINIVSVTSELKEKLSSAQRILLKFRFERRLEMR